MSTNMQWRKGAPPEGLSCAWLRIEVPYPDHDPQISALLAVLDDGIWYEAADWKGQDTLDPIEGEITHHIPYERPHARLSMPGPRGPFAVYGDSDVADAHGHVATAENAGLAALICHALNAQVEQAADAGVYLVSFAHRSTGFVQFWRAENAGYTPYVDEAGIYRRADLKPGYHDAPDVVPVPVHIVQALSLRCIDRGRASASIFSSPEALRAALADGL